MLVAVLTWTILGTAITHGASGSTSVGVTVSSAISLTNTFASSYGSNETFDYCANVPDAASIMRVMYR